MPNIRIKVVEMAVDVVAAYDYQKMAEGVEVVDMEKEAWDTYNEEDMDSSNSKTYSFPLLSLHMLLPYRNYL
jgi:hypothetical protein